MGAKARAAALARLSPERGGAALLVIATVQYVGEGFDCPALDTLFLAAPIASKGRLVQAAGRVLRPYPGKATAEVHDYHDTLTGVLASSLAKRAMRDQHGLQCGFCTPGILVSLTAADRQDLPEAHVQEDVLGGHVCRCTGYVGIRWAIEQRWSEKASQQ